MRPTLPSNSLQKEVTLALWSLVQCLFDQPLNKPLKPCRTFWFLLKSGMLWIFWTFNVMIWFLHTNQRPNGVGFPFLIMLELSDNEEILNEFDSVRCVKGLTVTWNNMSITWKVKPGMDIVSRIPSVSHWFSQGGRVFPLQLNLFQFIQHPRNSIYINKQTTKKSLAFAVHQWHARTGRVSNLAVCLNTDRTETFKLFLWFTYLVYFSTYPAKSQCLLGPRILQLTSNMMHHSY